jgi:hypothetical protein
MKIKITREIDLLNNLKFIDSVESKKTIYYIYQANKNYIVFSYRDSTYKSGNFNIVSGETIRRIFKIFNGEQRVTRRMIEEHPRMKRFSKSFDILQSLYVLVSLKMAIIDQRSKNSKTLFFNIKNRDENPFY